MVSAAEPADKLCVPLPSLALTMTRSIPDKLRFDPTAESGTVLNDDDAPSADAPVEKVCRICGENVAGKKRYKDKRGYLCEQCDDLERARRIECAECGKPTAPEDLRPWGPISICAKCHADREADPRKRRMKQVSSRHFEAYEKQVTIAVAGVLAFLGLLMILSKMGCIGG